MSYFYTGKSIGLKADIERHRKHEEELKLLVEKLESIPEDQQTKMDKAFIRTYRHCMVLLWESKAQLLEQLGRKQ